MTQDEIIEMACQAFGGLVKKEERDNFVAFAKLVVEKEREACAKIADEWSGHYQANEIAKAIRGQANG